MLKNFRFSNYPKQIVNRSASKEGIAILILFVINIVRIPYFDIRNSTFNIRYSLF